MKVGIICEFSGTLREAFRSAGHEALSVDLLPSSLPGRHFQCDALEYLRSCSRKDLLILHPPCTYIAASGLHWNKRRPERQALTDQALLWALELWSLATKKSRRVALENPVGRLSTWWRKPDCLVQPWQFGDDLSKATCWWLFGLPPLVPTNELPGGRSERRANQTASGQNRLSPSPDRWKLRSVLSPGMVSAIVSQWGLA